MLPLRSQRIVVTRPASQSARLSRQLSRLGATPIVFPTIRTEHVGSAAFAEVSVESKPFDWVVFTSSTGVSASWPWLTAGRLRALTNSARFAAVGPQTAGSLASRGVTADLIPDRYTGSDLIDALGDIEGRSILMFRGNLAPTSIQARIHEKGATLTSLTVYRTVPVRPIPGALQELAGGFEVVVFTSGSTAINFWNAVDDGVRQIARNALVACIGPSTAAAAEQSGMTAGLIATEFTTAGLINALCTHYRERVVVT